MDLSLYIFNAWMMKWTELKSVFWDLILVLHFFYYDVGNIPLC